MLDDFEQPVIARTLEEAGDALGWDVRALIAQGPAEQLDRTEHTQPALLAASIALWRLGREKGVLEPVLMAGHSLGEYSALVAAEALDFGEALRLVAARGRAMQQHAPAGAGMVAVLGLDDDAVSSLCARREAGDLFPVNFNAPGQVVVAGRAEALDWLETQAKAAGAKKLQRLAMSVPSHCPLLREAAEAFSAELDAAALSAPRVPVLHNIDAQPRSDVEGLRDALRRQLCEAVRWTQTQQAMVKEGVTQLVECGPGKVLCGLAKRGMKGVAAVPLSDPQALATLSAGRADAS
jgi:[acyl-carrier-protein] S-malonyltransferase